MKILVFNAGSSSLKFGVFDTVIEDSRIFKGEFEGFRDGTCNFNYRSGGENSENLKRQEKLATVQDAIARVPDVLTEFGYVHFDAIGHRVVHGGERFTNAVLIDDTVLDLIESCNELAPLHNPSNLSAIRLSRQLWGDKPQAAVFDTAFHHTIPERATTYAVPKEWRETGLRRYGFHGTSHKYVGLKTAKALGRPIEQLQIISCHLGNGASVCAINRGFSRDTSMGMTPLEGLIMGTRSGDVDPGMFAHLSRKLGLELEDIERRLYSDSGLKALAGSHDLRDIEQAAADGDKDAQLAMNAFAYRVRKYIGSYAAAMGGLDAITFTGGIGENSSSMRRRICDKFEFMGLYLDDNLNQAVKLTSFEAPQIQSFESRIRVLVTQASEQLMIALEVKHLLEQRQAHLAENWRIPVAVSARHVHLTQEAVETLFGRGHELTKLRDLSQPRQFAANETVEVIGPKGSLERVRVLGPTRSINQIEVSRTDTFALGVEAPVRESGNVANTPRIRLRGPAGEIETNGIIIAARHIHMSPQDATEMGLKNGDYVDVRLGNGARDLSFSNTLIRVSESFITEMHIDTDEANAAGISVSSSAELVRDDSAGAAVERRKYMALNSNGMSGKNGQ